MNKPRRPYLALLAGAAAAVLASLGALVAALAVQAARLPFNSEGRHFDGLVVHHAGAQYVYGAMALLAFALAGGLAWLACRWAWPSK